jgi:hypothetical protein
MNRTVLGMGSKKRRRAENIDIGNEALKDSFWLANSDILVELKIHSSHLYKITKLFGNISQEELKTTMPQQIASYGS